MEPAIPHGIDEVDDGWLSAAIGAPQRAVEVCRIAVGVGMVSSIYRVVLDGDGPASVIVKLPSLDEAAQFNAAVLKLNIREVGFYRELAAECPVRSPRCHYAAVDHETHNFVLVLEDLESLRSGDQVAGMSPADATQAVKELAAWHLHWWEKADPIVERGTAVSVGDPMYPAILPGVFAEGWEKVRSELTVPASFRVAAEGWTAALPGLLESLSSPPTTLGHGDFRADNMLFDGDDRLVMLDFQVIGQATGAYDLAYFVTSSLAPEIASEMERPLFDMWRDILIAGGVPGSDLSQAWQRYREAALFCICYGIIPATGMDLSEERTRALLESNYGRFERATDELNLPDLL